MIINDRSYCQIDSIILKVNKMNQVAKKKKIISRIFKNKIQRGQFSIIE